MVCHFLLRRSGGNENCRNNVKMGVDLNEESKLEDSDRPGTIIDVAAQRGSLKLWLTFSLTLELD